MNPQHLLFDLDDTLIHCNKFFDAAIEEFAARLAALFGREAFSQDEIKGKQLEIDMAFVNQHGFTTHHFPQSLAETYVYFCSRAGITPKPEQIKEVQAIGRSVYKQPVEPYPFMRETLDELREQGHILHLFTGGEELFQREKVLRAGIGDLFEERIFVARHKTAEAMQHVLRRLSPDPNRTWMIGNSLRTDIVPALQNRIHAIYIPGLTEWAYNVVDMDVEPQSRFITLQGLHEVPTVISRYSSMN